MNIAIFEDIGLNNLFPLVHLRAAWELKFGIRSFLEKYELSFPDAEITLHCRGEIREVISLRYPQTEVNSFNSDSYLFLNGRAVIHPDAIAEISMTEDKIYINGDTVIAARLSGDNLAGIRNAAGRLLKREDFPDITEHTIDSSLINYPWEFARQNAEEITREFKYCGVLGDVLDGAHLVREEKISVDRGAVVKPGAVLDASDGPVIISKNAVVLSHSYIQGPAFIGENTIVNAGTKIYAGTTIGETCKVGGEIAESIIHSFSNKQHDGFLGHAYLGSWINLGAGTNNSDMKNNYGNVRFHLGGEDVDTGEMFVGLIMGDHSKSGIGTTFNTGTHIGICCNIFGAGFPPKFLPSFIWGGADRLDEYRCDKAVETARRVTARRGIDLNSAETELLKRVFDDTVADRDRVLKN